LTDRGFTIAGGAKGVLLIHGLTGAPAEVRFLARRLNRQGFTVHAPNLPGHASDAELLTTTWRDWYVGVRAAYLRLRDEVEEVYCAGVCVGGALALLLAAEFPEIRGVAVYSMTFEYDGWNMARWAAAAPVIQVVANLPLIRRISFAEPYPFGLKDERLRKRAAEAQGELIEGALDRFPLAALFQMYRLGRQVERIGRQVKCPVLIAHAVDDDMAHPRNAERLARAIGGPVELLMLDDSYHMIHVDRQRDEVAAATARFFEADPAQAAEAA
jgi:carboxylesterase